MIDRSSDIGRVLVTGVMGSGGRYLAEYFAEEHPDIPVHGIARRKHMRAGPEGVILHEADLLDTNSLIRVIETVAPHAIFHVAANSDKGFDIPSAILLNNVIGTANLLEAVRVRLDPIIVVVSSSEVYGDVREEDVPIREDCPMRPMSPYAVSKAAVDHLARFYWKAYGTKTVVTRAFSYINNYHRGIFTSAFARQVAEIEIGKRDSVKHGNLDSVRTFVDTKDVMHAYWLAATQCRFGEAYNIGGEKVMSVREVLDRLVGLSVHTPGADAWTPIRTEVDSDLLRPADVTMQIPDCTKFREETGWEPRFDAEESLRGLLDYWRKEVRK